MRNRTAGQLALGAWMLALPAIGLAVVPREPATQADSAALRPEAERPASPLCFLPGNQGLNVFMRKPPAVIGNVPRPGEMRCDGWVIDLAHAQYDFRATDPDSAGTSPPMFWKRLDSCLAHMDFFGITADLRVTDDLLDELARAGERAVKSLCANLEDVISRHSTVMISFDTRSFGPQELALRDSLRRRLHSLPLGRVIRGNTLPSDACSGWDFLVVDAAHLRDDRARTSGAASDRIATTCPIHALVAVPDFDEELRLLLSGAAGLYHKDLPPEGSGAHDMAWRSLRSVSTFRHRLPAHRLTPFPGMVGPDTPMAFGTTGTIYCVRVRAGKAPTVAFPGDPAHPGYAGMWYNHLTDETIMFPRSTAPAGGLLRLQPPDSPVSWIFCYLPLPASRDEDTTTPVAVADPDISFEGLPGTQK